MLLIALANEARTLVAVVPPAFALAVILNETKSVPSFKIPLENAVLVFSAMALMVAPFAFTDTADRPLCARLAS